MPDITLFISLLFADVAGLPVARQLTRLAEWRNKVSELPCVKHRSGQEIVPGDLKRLGK
jgi:hypothetical protein